MPSVFLASEGWHGIRSPRCGKKNVRAGTCADCNAMLRDGLDVLFEPRTNAWNRRDEEEVIDPKGQIEELCKPKCVKFLMEYEACVERIKKDTTGEAHCTGQYFDYWGCIDKCTAPKLFSKLK